MRYLDLEKNFFGRTEILDLLKKRVIDLKEGYRQNIAFLGDRYVGKSVILREFFLNLDDEEIIAIYLEPENKDFQYFFFKFTGSLLYNYSKSKNLPLHDDFNLLLESTNKFIPNSVQVIKKIRSDSDRGKVTDAFLGLLALLEIFTRETGKFCVLILDEFQSLENFSVPDIFQLLGKKIMTQKKCFYIMSSSYPEFAKKILSEKLSLLFGNFEVINVEPFNLEPSQKFIEYNLNEIKIGIQLRNFLTDFTGGYPLYLNLICRELINLSAIHKQAEIYMPLLLQAVENTIFDRWGVITRHFDLIMNDICTGKGSSTISSVLISLSNGKHKIAELIDDVGVKKSQIMQRINRLLELSVVVKNGNFYYFKDKLFKYWIKYVYQKRLKDVEFAADKQKKQFKEEFNRLVETFKINSRKDFSSRIIELLYCFDNEAFDLKGRKYKLPLFREIVPFKVRNDNGIYFDVMKASTEDAVWFIVIKKDNVGENDVNAVLTEAKKSGRRPERYLIISLTSLNKNVKLKALQERFWIWSEPELNTLLTLFDKPYILY